MTTNTNSEIQQLHFKRVEKIEIITEDDRYLTTLKDMQEACRASEDLKTWKVQFEEFLADIRGWSEKWAEFVEGCYVAATLEGLKVFVTTKGDEFRFDFADQVADLELRLDTVYPDCPVEILQMPTAEPHSLQSFFSPKKAYKIYGEPEAA